MHVSHPLFETGFEGVDPASVDAFRAFKRAMMLHRRLMMATFSETPMPPAQAGCLQVLAHRSGISQSDLAELLHVSRPAVSTMLHRMESAGMIERRADEADSRVTRVYLTDEGRGLSARMHESFAEVLNTSIGWMPETDKREFARILTAINGHVAALLDERGVAGWTHPHHEDEGENA
jgi:DNA-binding MarR family transcriptional regulator